MGKEVAPRFWALAHVWEGGQPQNSFSRLLSGPRGVAHAKFGGDPNPNRQTDRQTLHFYIETFNKTLLSLD